MFKPAIWMFTSRRVTDSMRAIMGDWATLPFLTSSATITASSWAVSTRVSSMVARTPGLTCCTNTVNRNHAASPTIRK